MSRAALFAALLCVLAAQGWSHTARAFSDQTVFAQPALEGGGDGHYFTGSRADPYACSVCHAGGEIPEVTITGLPERIEAGERTEVTIRWNDPDTSHALHLELANADGAHVGLELTAPDALPAQQRCEQLDTGDPAVYAVDLGERRVLGVSDCGASELRFWFTAPDEKELFFSLGMVRSDGSGTPSGDGVLEVRRRIGARAAPESGCSVTATGASSDCSRLPFALACMFFVGLWRRRALGARITLASAIGALLWSSCGGATAKLTDAVASVYSRHDTDQTTVWSPRARVAGQVADRVEVAAGYMMDSWTSASIDIRTSATIDVRTSEAIPVHEKRHEVEASAGYLFDDATLSAGYRYSTENDYWSHGGVITLALDLAQKNTTLALSALGAHDIVGKYGDPRFERPLDSAGGRFTFTQVLTPESLMQLSWETLFFTGFQASPYRWVALGSDGRCAGTAPYCVPEYAPDERFRHALGARYRHALGPNWSAGAAYRFYTDSWGIRSQTIEPSLTVRIGSAIELSADYRYYTQNEADFYRPRYGLPDADISYVTRDRKLSALYSHAAGLSYSHRIPLAWDGAALLFALRGHGTLFHYLAYVGLDRVKALEVTGLVALEHP